MNCPRCAQPVEPGATFCGNCGQPMQASPVPAAAVPMPSTNSPPMPAITPSAAPAIPAQPAAPVPGAVMPGISPGPAPYPPVPTAGVPSAVVSPMAQALNNAGPMPQASPMGAGMAPMPGNAAAIPSYAIANPAHQKGETMPVVALVISAIAIPAAIIPIAGLVLGLTGIIMGTIVRSRAKKTTSNLTIILAVVALLATTGVFIYNLNAYRKAHGGSLTGASTGQNKSAASRAVTTPCYKVSVPQLATLDYDNKGCSFKTYNTSTVSAATEFYTVDGSTQSGITEANFPGVAKELVAGSVKNNLPGFTITSENPTSFAGSTAYVVNGKEDSGDGMIQMILIFHPSAHGENMFVVVHGINGADANAVALSGAWEWK